MRTSFQMLGLCLCSVSLLLLISCSAPRRLNSSEEKSIEFLIVISKAAADEGRFMSLLANSGYQPVIVNQRVSDNGFRILAIKVHPMPLDKVLKIPDLLVSQNLNVAIIHQTIDR